MATNRVNVTITAEDKTAAAFNGVKEKLSALQKAVHGFRNSFTGSLFKFTAAMDAIRGFEDMTKAAYANTVAWQGMEYTLQAAGLSAAQTHAELAYLEQTSLKLGFNIKDVSSAFSRFVLTGHAAGETLPALNEQFKSISAAMRIFHLSSQQSTRSWLALTEIMAMGKVQSRQFTQQLGRDWPGIGALIAGALFPGQDSMARFYAAMKEGKIGSVEFMNAFNTLLAQPAMRGALGGAVDSIQASMGRLHTAWFNLTNEANNPGALKGMTDALDSLTKTLDDPDVKRGFDSLMTGLAHLATWIATSGAHVVNFFSDIGAGIGDFVAKMDSLPAGLEGTTADIARLKHEIAGLQSEMVQPAYQNSTAQNFLQQQIDQKTKELQALQFALAHPALTPKAYSSAGSTPIPAHLSVSGAPDISSWHDWGQGMLANQQAAAEGQMQTVRGTIQYLQPLTKQINEGMATIKAQMASIPPDAGANFKAMADSLKSNLTQMDQLAVQAARNIQSSMAKAFENIGRRGNTLKDDLHALFRALEADAANILASELMGGAVSGMKSSNVSWISSLGSVLSAYFTGKGLASGGPIEANKISLVGEAGPELFMPHSSGTIIPNHALRGMGAHTTVNIDARGAGPDETAKLLAMRQEWLREMRGQTEYRLRRNAWMDT